MPISIIDSIASRPLTQDTMEAYTHAMIAHTQSQICSLVGLSESHGTSHRGSGDVPASGVLHQGPGPPTPLRLKTDGTLATAPKNIFKLSS
ncbi:hypothetical protein N7509_000394 [Penicillium cosmopolitanum]|uniref:Uncharacterized protein n=1 Tax=Penicillium cosmopolitanum TaxID=1131564 RepID=A0A9W9WAH7_9EURO|nr:uncharacterized protein N7509_000394 [Penicillium cosmopolitanum]KAJ5413767.1 hypothetical protein N7509_000394 [Penicillium cosmopolitanum]